MNPVNLWHRPLLQEGAPGLGGLCLFHLLVTFLEISGPYNQDFQECIIHRAPWAMTLTMTCHSSPHSCGWKNASHSIVLSFVVWFLPVPQGLVRLHLQTLPCWCLAFLSLQFLCFSVGQLWVSWGGEQCFTVQPCPCTTFLASGSWALNAVRAVAETTENPWVSPNTPSYWLGSASTQQLLYSMGFVTTSDQFNWSIFLNRIRNDYSNHLYF